MAHMTMKRANFRFLERLRVRWAEVDLQKIVFNGHYLMYFDTAVAGYWRAMALPYHDTMQALQGDLYVRKATLEYHGSARYDDLCEIGMRCARIGNSSMVFEGGVFRNETLLVSTELVYVFADPSTQTSRPVPASLREALLGFEAGEAMLSLRAGTWAEHGAAARLLRQQVFVEEQGIAAELAVDTADDGALHALALNRYGMALGTGRLLPTQNGRGQIGRMATLQALRGAGVGRALLDHLVAAAQARGDQAVFLHAQASAIGFYLRAGFRPEGPVFEEAGIPHQAMLRELAH
jgi:YbgC/YbaW family acyl-CoA thioester hydrolase